MGYHSVELPFMGQKMFMIKKTAIKPLVPVIRASCFCVCFESLHLSQQFFSDIGIISCLPGLNLLKGTTQ